MQRDALHPRHQPPSTHETNRIDRDVAAVVIELPQLETHGAEIHARVIDLLKRAGFHIVSEERRTHTGIVCAARATPSTQRPVATRLDAQLPAASAAAR